MSWGCWWCLAIIARACQHPPPTCAKAPPDLREGSQHPARSLCQTISRRSPARCADDCNPCCKAPRNESEEQLARSSPHAATLLATITRAMASAGMPCSESPARICSSSWESLPATLATMHQVVKWVICLLHWSLSLLPPVVASVYTLGGSRLP